MSTVLLSNFEKAVVSVVEHLFSLDKETRGFELKKELFDDLKMDSSNWGKIKTGMRHIPSDIHLHIRKTLINKYDVNPGYFDSMKVPMFLSNKFLVHDPAVPYGKKQDELQLLRAENAQLRELLETQRKLIEELEGKLKKSAK